VFWVSPRFWWLGRVAHPRAGEFTVQTRQMWTSAGQAVPLQTPDSA